MIDDTICTSCNKIPELQGRIEAEGVRQSCSVCRQDQQKAIALEHLLEQIDKGFTNVYGHVDSNAFTEEEEGDDLEEALDSLTGWDSAVTKLIAETLCESEPGYNPSKDGEPFYSEAQNYVKLPDEYDSGNDELGASWDKFKLGIKHEARFFPESSINELREIFGNLENAHGSIRDVIIRSIGPGTDISAVFRAREIDINNKKSVIKLLKNPADKFGAPPPRRARANRLNPTGIRAFYGSLDPMTCLAELRLPIGSSAIVVSFNITRKLRLLDVAHLPTTVKRLSPFHPNYVRSHQFLSFIRQFSFEISSPILPKDTHLDYIATQAVAEYLAHHHSPAFDGILYNSSQEGDGINIVLFQHACAVESSGELKGSNYKFYDETDFDDDDRGGYHIGYMLSYKPGSDQEVYETDEDLKFLTDAPDSGKSPQNQALQYIEGSATVYNVERVVYSANSLPIKVVPIKNGA
ncbi:MAG: RES family NAD+ phosphorylase [Magnetococcales bacterium]|nr:RES family NAD+ phosphorylase [Magnetococcales bacterium]